MSSKSFYVYELWNPLTNSVFYVGKGTKGRSGYRRLAEHIKDTRYYKAGKFKLSHKFNTISKIMDSGHMPEIKVVYETLSESDAIMEERRLIAHYGRRDLGTGILANHTNGGEGMAGYRHSQQHIDSLKTNNPGGKATAKPVVGICPITNSVVYKCKSSQEAAKLLIGTTRGKANINAACRINKQRTAYGFYWRYESEYDSFEDVRDYNAERIDLSRRNSKTVNQFKDGILVKTWNSASDICRHFGNHVSTLHRYLKTGEEWNGYTWSKN